jgi:hypothetical protein
VYVALQNEGRKSDTLGHGAPENRGRACGASAFRRHSTQGAWQLRGSFDQMPIPPALARAGQATLPPRGFTAFPLAEILLSMPLHCPCPLLTRWAEPFVFLFPSKQSILLLVVQQLPEAGEQSLQWARVWTPPVRCSPSASGPWISGGEGF